MRLGEADTGCKRGKREVIGDSTKGYRDENFSSLEAIKEICDYYYMPRKQRTW
jgi:hypothetical protein